MTNGQSLPLEFSRLTGARLAELAALRVQDIDLTRATVRFRGMAGRPRDIILPADKVAWVRDLIGDKSSSDRVFSKDALRRIPKGACHGARKEFAKRYLCRALGHEVREDIIERYLMNRQRHTRWSAKSIWKAVWKGWAR